MEKTKIIKIFSVFGALIVLGSPFFAAAQSEELKTAVDQVNQSIDKLVEAKAEAHAASSTEGAADTSSEGTMRLMQASPISASDTKDFELRKVALIKVLNLTSVEIKELSDKLGEIPDHELSKDAGALKKQFAADLKDFSGVVGTFKDQVNHPSLSLDGIKDLAIAVKEWRETTYDPATTQLFSFLLVYQGSQIIDIANSRFSKVATDVDRLQTIFGAKAIPLSGQLQSANAALLRARHAQTDAQDFLIQSALRVAKPAEVASSSQKLEAGDLVPPSVSSSSPSATVLAPASSSKEIATSQQETVKDFLRQALDQIRTTYGVFLEMSKTAKALLF